MRETSREHWDSAYQRDPSGLSWYEAEPTTSLELIHELEIDRSAGVVDVGGGTSPLAGRLLDRGFNDVTVLDISTVALATAQTDLGARADRVDWIAHDIRSWRPERRFDLWHDRAVFHFLVDLDDRQRYVQTLRQGLAPGGAVILATFAPDGPDHCSGLPVARYDAQGIAAIFAPELRLVCERREERATAGGTSQPLTWTVLHSSP